MDDRSGARGQKRWGLRRLRPHLPITCQSERIAREEFALIKRNVPREKQKCILGGLLLVTLCEEISAKTHTPAGSQRTHTRASMAATKGKAGTILTTSLLFVFHGGPRLSIQPMYLATCVQAALDPIFMRRSVLLSPPSAIRRKQGVEPISTIRCLVFWTEEPLM